MLRFNPFLPSHLQPDAKAVNNGQEDIPKIYAGMVTSQMAVVNPPINALPIAKTRLGKDPMSEIGLHQKPIAATPELIGPVTAPMPSVTGPHVQRGSKLLQVTKSVENGSGEKLGDVSQNVKSSDLELRMENALKALEDKEKDLESKSSQLDLKAKQLEEKAEELDNRLVSVQQVQQQAEAQIAHMASVQPSSSPSFHHSDFKLRPSHLTGKGHGGQHSPLHNLQSAVRKTMVATSLSRKDNEPAGEEEEAVETTVPQWMPINMNSMLQVLTYGFSYGAFIHRSFHHGLWSLKEGAVVRYGPLVCVSFLIQGVFAWELWKELPGERQPYVCDQPVILQLAAVGVFLFITFNNVDDMYRHAKIVLCCSHFRDQGKPEEEEAATKLALWERLLLLLLACASEFFCWWAILTVGILWILNATTSELIIRTTVAITFVLNVDEAVYATCVPDDRKQEHSSIRYKTGVSKGDWASRVWALIDEHLRTWILVGIACGVVFGVRLEETHCDPF